MGQKQEVAEALAYLLTGIAAVLLLPLLAPVVVRTNAHGYADKYSGIPGIQTGGGAISGIIALVYVAFFTSLLGGIAIIVTGGGVFVDADSGPDRDPDAFVELMPTAVPTLPPVEEENTDSHSANDSSES